jgi:hypothetical protein
METMKKLLVIVGVAVIMQMIYLGAPGQASAVTCKSGYRYNAIKGLCISLTTGASYNPAGIDPDLLSILERTNPETLSQFLISEPFVNQLDLALTADDLSSLGLTDINALADALNSSPNFALWSVFGSSFTDTQGMTTYSLTITRPASVPEPSTILLLGAGLFGLAGVGIMRRKKTAAK